MMASRLIALCLWFGGSVLCLQDIQLNVPEAVGVGTSAILGCRWALDTGETLYTVKWYHGAQEFFRFVPKELPNTRVFTQTGISVDLSRSGSQQVVLRDACRSLSGRYRCEVSADAPFFHTVYRSAYLKVVELPDSPPVVHAQKSWYSVGDMLRVNCSEAAADPPANLTWLLNGQEVKGLNIPLHDPSEPFRRKPILSDALLEDANRIIFSPWEAEELAVHNVKNPKRIDAPVALRRESRKDPGSYQKEPSSYQIKYNQTFNKCTINGSDEEKSNKTPSFSQLAIRLQSSHFHKGRINVTCIAKVLSAWSASSSLLLDEEKPQIALVMGSRDTTSGFRSTQSQIISSIISYSLIKLYWSLR